MLLPVLVASALLGQASGGLELSTVLAEVEARSPEIQVQRETLNVTRAGVGVAGAWEDPTFQVMVEDIALSDSPMGMPEMKPMVTYQVEQPLNVLWGRRGAAKNAAGARLEGDRARLRRVTWDAKAQAFQLFFELWMNQEMQRLLDRQIGVLERMKEVARARYRSGLMMGHHDSLRSEAEIAAMQAENAALAIQRSGIAAMLNALRGHSRDEPIGEVVLPGRIRLPQLDSVLAAVPGRPEISAAKSMKSEAEAEKALAMSMYYPMIMAGGGYQQRFSDEPDSVLGMMSLTVPVFWWDRQNNELGMARAMVARAEREIEAIHIMTEADIRMAWSRAWGTDRNLATLEGTALPRMRETVASGEAEYTSGKGDYLRLLEAITALLDLEKRRLELSVQREISYYELSRLLGTELEEFQ